MYRVMMRVRGSNDEWLEYIIAWNAKAGKKLIDHMTIDYPGHEYRLERV